MTEIDEVVEHVGGGRLVAVAADLAEAHIIDDQEDRPTPARDTTLVGAIGETGVGIGEEVDAAGVADIEAGLTGTQGQGLQNVTFTGSGLTGEQEVLLAVEKAQCGELLDDAAIEVGLEVEVEGLEGLVLVEAAGADPAFDASLDPQAGRVYEDALEELVGGGLVGDRLLDQGVEDVGIEADDAEGLQVSEESRRASARAGPRGPPCRGSCGR